MLDIFTGLSQLPLGIENNGRGLYIHIFADARKSLGVWGSSVKDFIRKIGAWVKEVTGEIHF